MKNPELRLHEPSISEAAVRHLTPAEVPTRPVEKLLHELQVHQIELEMQNETLRQTQISLEEARDRYLSLYEFAPVGYLTLTPEGLITEINLAGATFLGLERKKILQKHFASFVAREDQGRWAQHYARLKEADGQCNLALDLNLELALKRSDNTILQAHLSCTCQKAIPTGPGIRITLTDITSLKQAERERKQNLLRVESLMRHANDAILIFDASDQIIDVSDSCLGTYGYTRNELLHMKLSDLRAPCDCVEIPRLLQQLSELGSISYQTLHRRSDGNHFPVQVGATMIEINGIRYIQKIVRDISESVRQRSIMESGLATASRRLLELSRHLVEAQEDARRRLSGELHDHTSPNLAAIKINLGMVANALPYGVAPEFNERLADTMALLDDTDDNIREICADLRSPVLDYAGLPAAMEEYARRYTNRTGIAVCVSYKNGENGDTRLAPAVESLLFRIFQEALTNSLKHAKAKHIDVAIDFDAIPIVLSIHDDGIGFDSEPSNAEATTSGMGLLNMREMAEFAGGQMMIESHPGLGTRINVRIQA